MSSLFENYEQDYLNITSSISRKLNTQLSGLSGESRKATLRAIEREIDEADEILHSMEMELNSLPSATRTRLQPRLRNYRTDYEKLRAEYKKSSQSPSDRDELLKGFGGGGGGDSMDVEIQSMDQRSRLLAGTNRLNDASKRLADSHRVALETEQVGVNTLEMLRSQREQIVRANDTLDEANSFMDRNTRILKSMARRVATNRMLSIGVIMVLIFIIGLILYVKFG